MFSELDSTLVFSEKKQKQTHRQSAHEIFLVFLLPLFLSISYTHFNREYYVENTDV